MSTMKSISLMRQENEALRALVKVLYAALDEERQETLVYRNDALKAEKAYEELQERIELEQRELERSQTKAAEPPKEFPF